MALRPWATPCGSGRRSQADHRLPQTVLEPNEHLPASSQHVLRELLDSSTSVAVNELNVPLTPEPFCTAALMPLPAEAALAQALESRTGLAPCQPPPPCPEATLEDATAPFRSAPCIFPSPWVEGGSRSLYSLPPGSPDYLAQPGVFVFVFISNENRS